MTAIDLIAHDIPALAVEQTGRDAYHLLSDHHVKHLPVVDGTRLVGIISEEDVFNHKLYDPVSSYDFSMLRRFSVRGDEHLFEIIRVMGENRLTVIPVVDDDGNYLGMVSQNMLLRAFANTTSFTEPGGILILELDRRNYSLAVISRLIEEEDARVLSSMVTSNLDSDLLEVTLKVNRDDLTRIAAALERHDFLVKRAFAEETYTDNMKERYDSFMNYLNI
jgi:acetoin utilization protein AcuB